MHVRCKVCARLNTVASHGKCVHAAEGGQAVTNFLPPFKGLLSVQCDLTHGTLYFIDCMV